MLLPDYKPYFWKTLVKGPDKPLSFMELAILTSALYQKFFIKFLIKKRKKTWKISKQAFDQNRMFFTALISLQTRTEHLKKLLNSGYSKTLTFISNHTSEIVMLTVRNLGKN